MKLFTKCMTAVAASILATAAFAQEELRDAVDAGDIIAAQKMVKKGKIEEVYCGKLTPDDAVRVYEKVFKSNPEESFANCPTQFAYGYGVKACSNPKAVDACNEVVSLLLLDAETGNTKALDALENVAKVAVKTKGYAKPVKMYADTSVWVPCPKKGKARNSCMEDCFVQAQSMNDTLRQTTCETKPERFVEDTTITVMRPSPLYENLRKGLVEGYWKAPKPAAVRYADMLQANARALSLPDSVVINLDYVNRWADKHMADSTPLPGSELFRFCASWQPQVDSILASKELTTRCPVFEEFVDPRDNQKYKVREIGGIKWFVQNLNFVVEGGSNCYDRDEENCATYGRLYTQVAAQTACPEGTHLSTDEDWKALETFAGGVDVAAEKLRSNGGDDYAFTALFGGYANKTMNSVIQGEGAYFWTERQLKDGRGLARSMFNTDNNVTSMPVEKEFWLSVRCVVNGK